MCVRVRVCVRVFERERDRDIERETDRQTEGEKVEISVSHIFTLLIKKWYMALV